MSRSLPAPAMLLLLVLPPTLAVAESEPIPLVGDAVVVRALAVAETAGGLVGSVATVTIRVAEPGTGLLFMDTQPYTQVDMQGSARLAARVAASVSGRDVTARDLYFVVRSPAPMIGGPSAGAALAVGVIAALEGWSINESVLMTGTVTPDGSVGAVGGVPEKARAAAEAGATLFLYPAGQERVVTYVSGRPVRIEMSAFCATDLSIRCEAVSSVEDALERFTGRRYEPSPRPTDGKSSRLLEIMAPIARDEVARAEAALQEAASVVANASADVPPRVRSDVAAQAESARARLGEASSALNASRAYFAMSLAFQSSLSSRAASATFGLYAAEDPAAHLEAVVSAAERAARDASERATAASATRASGMEALGAAQVRAREALAFARTSSDLARGYLPDPLGALRAAVYADARAASADLWLRVASAFELDATGPIVDAQRAAAEAMSASAELVTYAEATLGSAGLRSTARESLDRATASFAQGQHARALVDAYEAQVRAALDVDLAASQTGVAADRVERAKAAAEQALDEALSLGLDPVLAASYLELADGLTDARERLTYYELARVIARGPHLRDLGNGDDPRPSAFVSDGSPRSAARVATIPGAQVALGPAISLAAGAAILAYVAGSRRARRPLVPVPPLVELRIASGADAPAETPSDAVPADADAVAPGPGSERDESPENRSG